MNANNYIQNIKVDFNQPLCENFLGLNAVYHAFSYMPPAISRGMSDIDRANELKAVKEARLRIARPMFIPAYNCENIEGPYNMQSPEMQGVAQWCGDLKNIGVEVALQTGWHYSRNTYHGRNESDAEKDPEIFATWAAESFSYLIDKRGLDNIKYCILFTEPTAYSSGITPDGYTIWTYYVKVCKAIDAKFKEYGLRNRIKFVGPNNCSGGLHLTEAVNDLNDVIDIYSGHDYNHVHQKTWAHIAKNMAEKVASTGKPFWMDEYGMQLEVFRSTPEYGNYIAQILTASINAGHQTSYIWTLFDQDHGSKGYYNTDSFHDGVHRWGVHSWHRDNLPGAGSPYPAWYAYVLLSKALGGRIERESGRVISCAAENAMTVYSAAVKQDGEYTVLIVNGNACEAEIEAELSGLPSDCKLLYRYNFAPFCGFPGYGTLSAPTPLITEHNMFKDILPKSGFCVYSTRAEL